MSLGSNELTGVEAPPMGCLDGGQSGFFFKNTIAQSYTTILCKFIEINDVIFFVMFITSIDFLKRFNVEFIQLLIPATQEFTFVIL